MERSGFFRFDRLAPAEAPGADFATTAWSCVLAAGGGDTQRRRRALEVLMARYWDPICQFIRAKWRIATEDAKDLTQQFMTWILETDFLGKADPRRGRFRHFVKTALNHFVVNAHRDAHRLKRRADGAQISITVADEALDARGPLPEEVLNTAWRRTLLESALERLQQAMASRGQEQAFDMFREYYLPAGERPEHKALASKHGLTPSAVSHRLEDARAELRRIIVKLVSESVTSRDELEEELRELFS